MGVEVPGRHDEDRLTAPVEPQQLVQPLTSSEAEEHFLRRQPLPAHREVVLAEQEAGEVGVGRLVQRKGHARAGGKDAPSIARAPPPAPRTVLADLARFPTSALASDSPNLLRSNTPDPVLRFVAEMRTCIPSKFLSAVEVLETSGSAG